MQFKTKRENQIYEKKKIHRKYWMSMFLCSRIEFCAISASRHQWYIYIASIESGMRHAYSSGEWTFHRYIQSYVPFFHVVQHKF